MADLTRQQVLDILQGDWATYVARFHRLAPEAQSAFLTQQGYARFADLLAHIRAWWEVGQQTIEHYLAEPQYQVPEYAVDAFNAAAVARVQHLDEPAVVQAFEQTRQFLVDFTRRLPEAAFADERVVDQFNMELVGHLNDHQLPAEAAAGARP